MILVNIWGLSLPMGDWLPEFFMKCWRRLVADWLLGKVRFWIDLGESPWPILFCLRLLLILCMFFWSDEVPDAISLDNSLLGVYSARSGYRWLIDKNHEHSNTRNWLWKSKLPENILFFIWQVCNHALPTSKMIQNRHIPISPTCPRCNHVLEDFFFSLIFFSVGRLCPFGKAWAWILGLVTLRGRLPPRIGA